MSGVEEVPAPSPDQNKAQSEAVTIHEYQDNDSKGESVEDKDSSIEEITMETEKPKEDGEQDMELKERSQSPDEASMEDEVKDAESKEDKVKDIESKEDEEEPEPANSLTSSATDSETSSLVETWTLVDKKDAEQDREESENAKLGVEDDSKNEAEDNCSMEVAPVETDSESIETISEDEGLSSFSSPPFASFCYVSGVDGPSGSISIGSTLSSFSVASDGIPIRDGQQEEEEVEELQYEWSTDGERELPVQQEVEEERLEPVMAAAGVVIAGAVVAGLAVAGDEVEEVEEVEQLEEVEELFERRSREPSGEPGQDSEPGYDLDDDGLPGAPLPPLQQSEDLYPSQELDDSFQGIERGEVYRHIKNMKVDSFLTACMVLAFALVVGLGVGHFLGLGPFAGLGLNRGDEFLDDFKSVEHFDVGPDNQQEFQEQLQMPTDDHPAFSLLRSMKNMVRRLGEKFGYIKKSGNILPEAQSLPSGEAGEMHFMFQCMTVEDKPIVVDGKPVMVSEPESCHEFFLAEMDHTVKTEISQTGATDGKQESIEKKSKINADKGHLEGVRREDNIIKVSDQRNKKVDTNKPAPKVVWGDEEDERSYKKNRANAARDSPEKPGKDFKTAKRPSDLSSDGSDKRMNKNQHSDGIGNYDKKYKGKKAKEFLKMDKDTDKDDNDHDDDHEHKMKEFHENKEKSRNDETSKKKSKDDDDDDDDDTHKYKKNKDSGNRENYNNDKKYKAKKIDDDDDDDYKDKYKNRPKNKSDKNDNDYDDDEEKHRKKQAQKKREKYEDGDDYEKRRSHNKRKIVDDSDDGDEKYKKKQAQSNDQKYGDGDSNMKKNPHYKRKIDDDDDEHDKYKKKP